MALVTPLSADHDDTTKELAAFFNETLGFCPNSVLPCKEGLPLARLL